MFDAILGAMAGVLNAAETVDGVRRDTDFTVDAGPFSEEEYGDNLAASAKYETMLAVRKAHTRLRQGYADDALALLLNCRVRLPPKAETKMLDNLIAQLREARAK